MLFKKYLVSKVFLGLVVSIALQAGAIAEESKSIEPESTLIGTDARGTETVRSLTQEEQQEVDRLVGQVVDRAKKADNDRENARNQVPNDVIRINYIPETIKEEIRKQVREELRKDVVKDVIAEAEKEEWGIPGALPSWINRITFSGDIRIRAQADIFDNSNTENSYFNIHEINDAGGQVYAGRDQFINTTEDRNRARLRARFGVRAEVSDGLTAGLRISTGNRKDPVSTNQTLGNYSNKYELVWDQIYLKYVNYDFWRYPRFSLSAGRMPNPWLSTDLVWDKDLAFEGLSGVYSYGFGSKEYANKLQTSSANVEVAIGAFPLQEVELSSDDKWLYGAQLRSMYTFSNNSIFRIGLSYYSFENITGVRNTTVESKDNDFTAPDYVQKGNLFYNIRNSSDPDAQLWALAAEYQELNLTITYEIPLSEWKHVKLTADIVKNLGYDEDEIIERVGGVTERSQGWDSGTGPTKEKTLGYQLGVTFGWSKVNSKGRWSASLFYKHLERDAVLDAFTDSDFHLGGTDAEGWILSAKYGIKKNSWLSMKLLSTDTIDGVPMGVNTVQIDWNAKF
jgi:hypothetical protein